LLPNSRKQISNPNSRSNRTNLQNQNFATGTPHFGAAKIGILAGQTRSLLAVLPENIPKPSGLPGHIYPVLPHLHRPVL
jgi:hypothetical protein